MSQIINAQFGAGVGIFTPYAGNLATNPTPVQLRVMQEASVEFKGDTKTLFGNKQFPVAIARGKVTISGKGKFLANDANDINQLYFAQTVATGGSVLISGESHAPGVSITPTGTPTSDQGVINGDTNKSMQRVAATPAVGQYTYTPPVTGGSPAPASYGFNASETAASVLIAYTKAVTSGSTLTIKNQLMGYAPVLALELYNATNNKNFNLALNAVMLGQFSVPTKQEDFWVSDFDFQAFADATDTIGTIFWD